MNRKTMIGIVLAGLLMGTTAAQGEAPVKPETVWPISWISLGTSILLVCDLIARAFGMYRVGAGALEKKLDDQEKKQTKLLEAQTRHFDDKMAQTEQRLEQKFNSYTATSELRMNGFGGRLADVESDQTGANAKLTVFEGRMSASEVDRANINKSLDEIKRGNETILQHILTLRRG